MDAILGYHLNPLTCGVAKCNYMLAERMDIPVLSLFDERALDLKQPLLSIKVSEFTKEDIARLDAVMDRLSGQEHLRVFFHDFSNTDIEFKIVRQCEIVYCGNAEVAAKVKSVADRTVDIWCPPMLSDQREFGQADTTVFSFGMAHKVQSHYYNKLKDLLEKTGGSYRVYLSTALHEDSTFEGSFSSAFEELEEIFGENIFFLGFLSDTAVFNYLTQATFFTAFFDHGARANNSSVNAAMETGPIVITNLDEYSPQSLIHLDSVIDINKADFLPTDSSELARIRTSAKTAAELVSWDALVTKMAKIEAGDRRPDGLTHMETTDG
jgi:hypothetical protein